MTGHPDEVTAVAFSPDDTTLATADKRGGIWLWDVATGARRTGFAVAHGDRIWRLAYTSDGMSLISAGQDGTLRRWDAATGVPVGEPLGNPEKRIESAALHMETEMAAMGHKNGTVSLLDLTSGRVYGAADSGSKVPIHSVELDRQGTRLAAGTQEGVLLLWTVGAEPAPVLPLGRHTGSVRSLVFATGEDVLFSAGDDGLVLLWPLTPESETARACHIANRSLTQAEWEQFVGADSPYQATCGEQEKR
jgi:WD40 repeat protein